MSSRNTLHIAVLCAEWCGVCRSLRPDFERWASQMERLPLWIDVEDEAELLGEMDIEDFPTLLLADAQGWVQFLGPVLPQIDTLQRMVTAAEQAPLQASAQRLSANWLARWKQAAKPGVNTGSTADPAQAN